MADFDFSGFTDDQIMTGYERAVAANDFGNALMLKAELDRRMAKPAAETSLKEQALGGLYEGLARGLGAPVDIVAGGMRKVGLPVGEAPVGGAESIKGLLGTISGGAAIPEVGPQTAAQRIVRGGTEAVGESIPAAAALALAGPKAVVTAVPSAWNAFKAFLGETGTAARSAPAAYAATEAATSAASGLAGKSVAELFPENPTAEFIGSLLGAAGGATGARAAERILAKTPQGPLSAADMKSTARSLYEDQIASGVSAPPTVTRPMFRAIYGRLKNQGLVLPDGSIDPEYGKVSGLVSILGQYARSGMDGAQLLRLRQNISSRLNDAQGTEKNALRNILRQFDEATGDLAPTIKTANALYARSMKAEQLDDMMELARINSGMMKQGGMENAIRAEFRQLARRIVKGQETGWTPEEVQQITQIAEGGSLENALRFVGNFAPRGIMSTGIALGMPFSAAMKVTNDPYVSALAAGTVAATGVAGKAAATELQKGNVDRLMATILQGRNMSKPAQDRLRAAITAYMAGQATTGAADAMQ